MTKPTDDLASAFRGKQLHLAPDYESPLEQQADGLREADAALKAAREAKDIRG